MMEACRQDFPKSDLEHGYSLISAIFNASFGAGQALGPLIGTVLYTVIGFRFEFTAAAVAVFLYAFLYIFLAEGCSSFRQLLVNYSLRHEANTAAENRTSYKTDIEWQKSTSTRGSKNTATLRMRLH